MFKLSLYILFSFSFYCTRASDVPSIKPCKADDKECLLASAHQALTVLVKGIPEYGIAPLDPVFVKSGKSENPNLSVKYSDLYIYGLKDTKFLNIERDVTASTIKLVMDLPLIIKGQYNLKGKLLILDVSGKGEVNIKTDKIKLILTLKLKNITGSDSLNHWKIHGFDLTYVLEEKVYINLANLLGDNKVAGDAIKEIIDTNYAAIVDEVGKPIIIDEISNIIADINKLLERVPTDKLEIV